jgi:hypothetical protein
MWMNREWNMYTKDLFAIPASPLGFLGHSDIKLGSEIYSTLKLMQILPSRWHSALEPKHEGYPVSDVAS